MKSKMLALGAITALALSAHAQTYNWTLTTSGDGNPGNGSGTLTLTSGVITSMSGTVGGSSVSLLPIGTVGGNDNKLPLNNYGLGIQAGGYVLNVFKTGQVIIWVDDNSVNDGPATFGYTPVPEPATWATGGVFGLGALLTVAARRRRQAAQPG